jgi:hypothetical protein
MSVEIRPVSGRAELKQFILLPEKIHEGHARWTHPIYMDEWQYFSPKKNKAFSCCDTLLALAWREGKPVGRIMGIVNRRYNERSGEKVARFGYLECYEEQDVCNALLSYVEDWARKLGMDRIVGPMGFSDQDAEGFLVEGFDEEPTISTYYNFEFLPRFIEQAGYSKELDYVVYGVPVPAEVPALYRRVSQRLERQQEFRLLEFRKTSELKPYIRKVLGLMNDTFGHLYGYVPLDDEEMDELAKRYLPVIDPRFVKAALKGDDVVAFILGIPNMNEGIRKARGRLFPFGVFHILGSAKRSKQLDILLGAIRQDCRGRGLDVMIGAAMLRSAREAGFTIMDSHHEMETNLAVRAEMERAGGKVIKRQRIWQKSLRP